MDELVDVTTDTRHYDSLEDLSSRISDNFEEIVAQFNTPEDNVSMIYIDFYEKTTVIDFAIARTKLQQSRVE